ncbi:hypothetical protein CQ393_18025, partial [Stenotrophomonas sp. MYb238]|nr:hypothetical protein [Stenotrophomonas sp. MYb238]
ESLRRDIPLLMQPRDEMPAEHRFAQNFSTHLSNKNSWTSLGKVHPMKPQTIKWYTDGSLTDEGSGLGVVGLRLKYHESMGRYTSIFQAEVCAIGRCAEFNLQRNYRGKDIAILSDSQAAIKALSKAKITSKLVNEVRTALDKLGAVNKLTIRWVPGHNIIPGNKLADNLARKGQRTL